MKINSIARRDDEPFFAGAEFFAEKDAVGKASGDLCEKEYKLDFLPFS